MTLQNKIQNIYIIYNKLITSIQVYHEKIGSNEFLPYELRFN